MLTFIRNLAMAREPLSPQEERDRHSISSSEQQLARNCIITMRRLDHCHLQNSMIPLSWAWLGKKYCTSIATLIRSSFLVMRAKLNRELKRCLILDYSETLTIWNNNNNKWNGNRKFTNRLLVSSGAATSTIMVKTLMSLEFWRIPREIIRWVLRAILSLANLYSNQASTTPAPDLPHMWISTIMDIDWEIQTLNTKTTVMGSKHS